MSGAIVYKEGDPVYRDYLMENGIWKLRIYYEDGRVIVNPNYPNYRLAVGEIEEVRQFSRKQYESLDQVIEEVLKAYVSVTEEKDLFCVAMQRQHTAVLTEALKERKTIASFYGNRYALKKSGLMQRLLQQSGYVVADSEETIDQIKQDYAAYLQNVMYISPFDSRVDFGISQQLTVKKIMVPVDNLSESLLREATTVLCHYLLTNPFAQVHFFTRSLDPAINRRCLELVQKIAPAIEEEADEFREEAWMTEMLSERPKTLSERFFVENCVDELSVSKCMREQRILVDLRDTSDLYLQIVAISMGIPQIVKKGSQFVKNRKNGRILSEIAELKDAVAFYMDGLENWNDAMVHSYELSKEFSTDVLIEKWKEVLASFE